MRRVVLRLVGALIIGNLVWAATGQAVPNASNTGAVRVQVAEEGTGKPIPFANVISVGAHVGALADTVGHAVLSGLDSGKWIIRVQVLRREPKIDTVTVAAGETTSVSVLVGPLTVREPDCVLDVRRERPTGWSAVGPRPCGWRVSSSRAAGRGDIPFDEGQPMLGEPENWNSVPGPGTLRAVVRNLKGHHPSILIEDAATGSSRLLLKPWASQPLWSPDGRWIACNVYGSPAAPYNLALVEVEAGRVTLPDLGAQIGEYRWSPDSRYLALELTSAQGGFTVLGFFSLSTQTFTPADTLTLFADYAFSWSPDAHAIAVSKPTFTDREHEDEVTQADLWLMDVTGARCRLVEGRGFIAAQPRWIDSAHVRYVRDVWKVDGSGPSESLVVALRRSQ
jgi:hypothetical protein